MSIEASATDLRLVAKAYRDRRWDPVPLRHRSKAPIHNNWPVLVADDRTAYPGNIGVKLGEASGGLVDADLDCQEARLLAPAVLPATGSIFGRAGAPGSHRLYQCVPPPSSKVFTDAADRTRKTMLVEVRSSGGQTMFPTSVHPSGERVAWEADGQPGHVSGAELVRSAGVLAAAALLLRHWPAHGTRYFAYGALIGTFLRCGVAAETVEGIVRIINNRHSPDRHTRDRIRAVEQFKRRLDAGGDRVPGFPRLKEIFGADVAGKVKEWLPRETGGGDGPVVNPRAPYDLARLFRAARFTADERPILHYHRDNFYAWDGACYPEITESEIRSAEYDFLDQCSVAGKDRAVPLKPNAALVSNVTDALRAAALLADRIEAPAWLSERPELDPLDIVACHNGLLHLPTGVLHPHTPLFLTHNAVDFAFDPDAPSPAAWLRFLRELWGDDAEAIETLQEFFGYALTADTSQQKILLIVGPARSGKGTIARVLRGLAGPDNVVAPTLAGLSTNFGLEALINRRVAIISDARLGRRTDRAIVAERLLSITGEDAITADRKYRKSWTGRIGVRFLILTNELPGLADTSGALVSRFIILVLTESFLGREDHGLIDRLLPERPSILNWSIDGWRRLRRRGHFRQPASGLDATKQMGELASPISAFLDERCEIGVGYAVPVDHLFGEWERWCEGQRRQNVGTKQSFGRDLRAVRPNLVTKSYRQKGSRGAIRCFEGIRIKDALVLDFEPAEAEEPVVIYDLTKVPF
jgi:putative DNA primase/helicase